MPTSAIEHVEVTPLSIPLLEPFVIASGRVDTTRAVLVRAVVSDARGRRVIGLGEAAALPPVTREDQPELLQVLTSVGSSLRGATWSSHEDMKAQLDAAGLQERPVARAGLECALLDAEAHLAGLPMCTHLSGESPRVLATDITLPIAAPEHMAELARQYRTRGFEVFKVKIGKHLDDDLRALTLISRAVPDARFRLDANAAFTAEQAVEVLERASAAQLLLECFEQPCAREDLAGMAQVTARSAVPVIADESVRDLADLERVHAARAAHGVNLKLAKSGGLLAALRIGQRAREMGMRVMCGGMVETRLGMSAMAHVACALGGVDFVDLDTAFLLARDPFAGGYASRGSFLTVGRAAGLGVREVREHV
jgi:L-alanine-DL-glutamate epimerase-like enolase superfamily enzyme